MSAVILLGPLRAGKGTWAIRVGERLSIPVISIGEIFCSNMAEGTEVGKQAKSHTDRGESVPDSITNVMVKARLLTPDAAQGFLSDSYLRSVEQVWVLAGFCEELDTYIGVALEIQVDEDEVATHMFKRAGEQRWADDGEPIIRHRLKAYREQTEPVASFYTNLDLPETANGSGSIDEVSERISTVLDTRLGR